MTQTPRASWTTPSLDLVTDVDATSDVVAPARNGNSLLINN